MRSRDSSGASRFARRVDRPRRPVARSEPVAERPDMTAERPPASPGVDRLAVLVTSGRFPPATALVRAFHLVGARVNVADSYPLSPALHSHRADRAHVIAPPASQPLRFVDDVAEIVRTRAIDLVVPELRGDLLAGPVRAIACRRRSSRRRSRRSPSFMTRAASWRSATGSAFRPRRRRSSVRRGELAAADRAPRRLRRPPGLLPRRARLPDQPRPPCRREPRRRLPAHHRQPVAGPGIRRG